MKQAKFANVGLRDRLRQILGFDVTGPYLKSANCFSGKRWSFPLRSKPKAYRDAKAPIMKMENADRPPKGIEVSQCDHGER